MIETNSGIGQYEPIYRPRSEHLVEDEIELLDFPQGLPNLMVNQEFLTTMKGESNHYTLQPIYGMIDQPMAHPYLYEDEEVTSREYEQIRNRMIFLLFWAVAITILAVVMVSRLMGGDEGGDLSADSVPPPTAELQPQPALLNTGISPVFAPPVQHWAPQIVDWANQFALDPDIVATIMQIESCGDPYAESWAGAQGLFQVMPFHFGANENMKDPATNAYRGMTYFTERMAQTNNDIGLSLAGYNGGHGASGSSWDYWAAETQSYYTWGTGIYNDAKSGNVESQTLNEWLMAGGQSLCNQASDSLGLNY